jgi:hypothetical protein
LSVGPLAVWNLVTFATLSEENSVLDSGPLPHQLHERFLFLWAALGVAWGIVLASAAAQRIRFRAAVALAALIRC